MVGLNACRLVHFSGPFLGSCFLNGWYASAFRQKLLTFYFEFLPTFSKLKIVSHGKTYVTTAIFYAVILWRSTVEGLMVARQGKR